MTVYIVSYTLKQPGQDYQSLYDALEALNAHREQESFWLVNVSDTAKVLHNHLKGVMDENDRLWVSELTTKNFYSGAKQGTNDWL